MRSQQEEMRTYNFGKFVGVFLFKGSLGTNGVAFHVCGYGEQFTREVYDFIMGYGDSTVVGKGSKLNEDSTTSVYFEGREMRDRVRELFYQTEEWDCPITADGVVSKCEED